MWESLVPCQSFPCRWPSNNQNRLQIPYSNTKNTFICNCKSWSHAHVEHLKWKPHLPRLRLLCWRITETDLCEWQRVSNLLQWYMKPHRAVLFTVTSIACCGSTSTATQSADMTLSFRTHWRALTYLYPSACKGKPVWATYSCCSIILRQTLRSQEIHPGKKEWVC